MEVGAVGGASRGAPATPGMRAGVLLATDERSIRTSM